MLGPMKMTPISWAATNRRRGEEKPTNEEARWRWLPVVLILVHGSQHQHSYTNFLPLLYPASGHSEVLVSWQLLLLYLHDEISGWHPWQQSGLAVTCSGHKLGMVRLSRNIHTEIISDDTCTIYLHAAIDIISLTLSTPAPQSPWWRTSTTSATPRRVGWYTPSAFSSSAPWLSDSRFGSKIK